MCGKISFYPRTLTFNSWPFPDFRVSASSTNQRRRFWASSNNLNKWDFKSIYSFYKIVLGVKWSVRLRNLERLNATMGKICVAIPTLNMTIKNLYYFYKNRWTIFCRCLLNFILGCWCFLLCIWGGRFWTKSTTKRGRLSSLIWDIPQSW